MKDYKTTIVCDRPNYVGKRLLLINKNRDKLFKTIDSKYLEIEVDNSGELSVYELSKDLIRVKIDSSLRKIGETFLGLNDPSVPQILNYFILPEMEVERIFNNLRYKYLKAIQLSKFENPNKLINAEYNKSFQALADINVYQGNTQNRQSNDSFWKNAGFTQTTKDNIDFDMEKKELAFIISYFRSLELSNFNKIYSELIAIKPGFHELLIHEDYFNETSIPKDKGIRSKVFRLLKGKGELSELEPNRLLPHEINSKSYFTYASCNITEGPFVFRKSISVSYYDEIRKIKSIKDLEKFKDNFYFLNYCNHELNTIQKLNDFLLKAEKFRYFM
ncbi:MAG TPA: hypothetical protein VJB35_00960 [Candidatus Nanoarchaeia archaeon]|nr:hypothetical protein [Candidatus Nanoarchaeia archaeon]